MSNKDRADGGAGRMSARNSGKGTEMPKHDMRSISQVSLSQVVGLVEAVDEMGGEADAAAVADDFDMDLASLGPVIDAAEFLGLVTVVGGDLRITELSRKVLGATLKQRKAMFREILREAPVFREVLDMARVAGRPLTRDEVVDSLAARFGTHSSGDFFKTLVYWGRYVEMVRYDSQSERFSLTEQPE